MFRPRVIPSLLIQDGGLVKTRQFKTARYVGDPINAVKIFNEKEVDELVILDISAARARTSPAFDRIAEIASEAFMPIGYGGGVTSARDCQRLVRLGVEKVIINTAWAERPSLLKEAADAIGGQSVVASIDVRKGLFGPRVVVRGGRKNTRLGVLEAARIAVENGAGEILLTSVDREGTRSGFDEELISQVAGAVDVPLIAQGGANDLSDLHRAVEAGASAVAAGAMFVFQGKLDAVLITYPTPEEVAAVGRVAGGRSA